MTGGERGLASPRVAVQGGAPRAVAHLVLLAVCVALLVSATLAGVMWALAALLHHAATA
ncbi:MAG TPA: hypothetical protein VKU88_07945 [Acidimicrobiales bacterium]|nr:hypothetical protein [Acidimicrobiales bacterium]